MSERAKVTHMRTPSNSLTIRINSVLFNELCVAAAEASSVADEPVSPSEYAAEIVESYMATRRLEKADAFIDEAMTLIDKAFALAR